MSPVKKIALACALSAAVLLAGCGSNTNQSAGPSEAASSSAMPTKASGVAAAKPSPTPEPTPDKPEAGILEVGFGQDGENVKGVAIVQANDSGLVPGSFVTVSFNFLDKDGQIVSTSEGADQFKWSGQKLVVTSSEHVGDQEVASVDAVLSVMEGIDQDARDPIEWLETTDITVDKFDRTVIKFLFKNQTEQNLEHLEVGVACRDNSGTIVGGGNIYPSLVGASAEAIFTLDYGEFSTTPAKCEASVNYSL